MWTRVLGPALLVNTVVDGLGFQCSKNCGVGKCISDECFCPAGYSGPGVNTLY